jgi:hypothetical protein
MHQLPITAQHTAGLVEAAALRRRPSSIMATMSGWLGSPRRPQGGGQIGGAEEHPIDTFRRQDRIQLRHAARVSTCTSRHISSLARWV